MKDNAQTTNEDFYNELLRVIIHGVLHLLGWKDSTSELKSAMRLKESELIEKFYNVPRGTLKE